MCLYENVEKLECPDKGATVGWRLIAAQEDGNRFFGKFVWSEAYLKDLRGIARLRAMGWGRLGVKSVKCGLLLG